MRTLHPAYRVTDLATSLAFYGAIGFEQIGRVDLGEGVTLTMLKFPADEVVTLERSTGRPTDQWSSAAGSATSRCKSMTSTA
jgi:lactoylglutathione lyase